MLILIMSNIYIYIFDYIKILLFCKKKKIIISIFPLSITLGKVCLIYILESTIF